MVLGSDPSFAMRMKRIPKLWKSKNNEYSKIPVWHRPIASWPPCPPEGLLCSSTGPLFERAFTAGGGGPGPLTGAYSGLKGPWLGNIKKIG